jgi:hypothetical protein
MVVIESEFIGPNYYPTPNYKRTDIEQELIEKLTQE